MSIVNENRSINTRNKARKADEREAYSKLEAGMNVAFKFEGAGKYGVARVVSKPRQLTARTRTDTEYIEARVDAPVSVVDVEVYEKTYKCGVDMLTLAVDKCSHLYCDCGPNAECYLQHTETKRLRDVLTYNFKLATPRRSGRASANRIGELQYFMTPLVEQKIKQSFTKYSLLPS
jgi:hypothetical protein